ncbi:hypothetical protein [Mycobacteroides abscessus]|uniref:hypothetical protein n=1 Tax=Mycobacteroides abscessus TaxID=36809 RepID=UPI00092B0A3A|nr:hypothetical protein [Mycobacteroides abscessus]SHP98109.1 Uncharacterised protein [Mycobacteroides abscessus subsp. abscessus]SHQ60691.1 Uncharacterised protein [Mycobacteroides abscessus subsp. abscessus]SKD63897.1 Uncharacterised protein [Mycobacteroides abscessus subsp. abscessus]SLD62881.1 Uncharacterised protein [Mycobacteroides abscessus subsp. abscessus]
MTRHLHGDTLCTCPETAELLARLDAAGVEYERVSMKEALRSDEPMYVYPEDFTGGSAA